MTSFQQTLTITGTVVQLHWSDFKSVALVGKSLFPQFIETAYVYTVFAVDGPISYVCEIFKTEYSSTFDYEGQLQGYTKEQNDLDLAEFESTYKAKSNLTLEPKAKDGRMVVRNSTANRTTNFKLRCFSFYTARGQDGVHNVNPVSDKSYDDVTIVLYDQDDKIVQAGQEVSAVKTVIDWEPRYNYEIIGGYMDLPFGLAGGDTDVWFLSAVGVPDYPPQFYGSVDYLSEINLEAVTTQKVVSDGRAISYLPYNLGGMPHTNKMRFIVKHPAGASKRFQFYVEHFV